MVLLLNKKESLWIILRNQEDGKVRGTIFKKIEDPTPQNMAEAEKRRANFLATKKK